ncbi:hypothetical protein C8J56DRAFT_890089 [Mycena floridula]|nr:hypothetical protein C8J56DRAFT_890089 [Mycena floridula]
MTDNLACEDDQTVGTPSDNNSSSAQPPLVQVYHRISQDPAWPTLDRAKQYYDTDRPWVSLPNLHDNAKYLIEPGKPDKIATFTIVARIRKTGETDRSGPYFSSVTVQNGRECITLDSMKKSKVKFEVGCPVDILNPDGHDVPDELIQGYKTLISILHGAVNKLEADYSDNLQPKMLIPDKDEDDWALTAISNRPSMYINLPDPLSGSPSKKKSSKQPFSLNVPAPNTEKMTKRAELIARNVPPPNLHEWTIYDMYDPQNHYQDIGNGRLDFNETFIYCPNIRDQDGRTIHPSNYSTIRDGELVLLKVHFKCWVFTDKSSARPNHIYHTILDEMQLLPTSQDIVDAMFKVDKGKCPAEGGSKSIPSKKVKVDNMIAASDMMDTDDVVVSGKKKPA